LWVALPGFIISCGPSKIDFNTGEELIFLVKIDTLSKDRGKDFLFLEGNTESGVGWRLLWIRNPDHYRRKLFLMREYTPQKKIYGRICNHWNKSK
jgi:hypothetical protein